MDSFYDEVVNEDFSEIAEMYFNNYLIDWCRSNHIDPHSQEHIKRVLSDYSAFFFDSLMHRISDGESSSEDLKN
jgi:hypothetical protein